MSKKIYAVLVGINKYNSSPLFGCVNDIEAVDTCLKNNYNSEDQLSIVKLTDEEAKKQNIIKAFDHFDQANGEDTCLFYYCGHGTNLLPPEEFNYEPALQALVCQDWSGKDDGNGYLIDKELSFLIWQKTLNKPDLSFVVITDCCHSGTITRDITAEETEPEVRGINAVFKSPPINEFAGYSSTLDDNTGYRIQKKSDGDKLVVSGGKYIHFAAAQDDQKAYEIKPSPEIVRGGFTYFLVDMINKFQGKVTYQDMYDHVGRSITGYFIGISKTKKQFPCFSLFGAEKDELIGDRILFTKDQKETKRSFELYYDARKNKMSWFIDAGQTEGISTGDEIAVEASESMSLNFKVGDVFRDYSVIATDITDLDKSKRYKVSFTKPLQTAIPIHFEETVPLSIQQQLVDEWNKNNKDERFYNVVFETLTNVSGANPVIKLYQGTNLPYNGFYLEYKDNLFCLCDLSSSKGLLNGSSLGDNELNLVIDNLTKSASWVRLLTFKNKAVVSDAAIPYKIDLKCSNGLNEKGELLFADRDWRSRQIMKYSAVNTRPAFQLNVSNTFTDALFVSFAYLSADAAIDTKVFNWLTVEAGKTMPISHDGIDIIPLAYEPEESDSNEFCTEYLKIFISKTKLIPLGAFDQKPLDKSYEGSSRALGFKKVDDSLESFEWQAEAICFSIQRKPK